MQPTLSETAETEARAPRWPHRSLGTTILADAVGPKREFGCLVGGFDLGIGAFAFNAAQRERGPRGDYRSPSVRTRYVTDWLGGIMASSSDDVIRAANLHSIEARCTVGQQIRGLRPGRIAFD